MNDEKELCPLFYAALIIRAGRFARDLAECKSNCAWRINGGCAILEIIPTIQGAAADIAS